jgi:hypothetical protein
MMKIEVVEIIENEDGSANIQFDMSSEAILAFAKIGLLHSLTDAANASAKEHEIELDDEEAGC